MDDDHPVLTFPQVDNRIPDDKNKLRATSPFPGRQGPRGSQATLAKITPVQRPPPVGGPLTLEEKKFLIAVERGDLETVRRTLSEVKDGKSAININCTDPIGRSALLMAIDNENLKMFELLIEARVDTRDALLHAINEQYVEAVEVLLHHEEENHQPGEPHSWEAMDRDAASFTPDITPLILAAHRDNYEIIKILLDRGATLPVPHDVRCGCDECVTLSSEDSLRHSRSRINAYRALASPSLISLSSKDPIMTAFELSWELRRLSVMEQEFKLVYQELRKQCQDFATALLDHTRSSYELEILLNHDPNPASPDYEQGDRMHLNRLKLAIKYKQKKFCAHSNVQQLLASLWYDGLPGFRRKNMILQTLEIARIGLFFPFYSLLYICAPRTYLGKTLRKPFIKFICHSASYITFLFLLILASQRIETRFSIWRTPTTSSSEVTTKRGAQPTLVEWMILAWVMGLIWNEIKQLWEDGLMEYISDMWNIIDFVTNSLYVATIGLRIVAYFQVQKELRLKQGTAGLAREYWDAWDPMLIAEGLFSAANILSSLKLVYIFSVNPHLGPLQISLGRMVIDIIKFFFIYTLVLFSFACGMNQLLWYYAELERNDCLLKANTTTIVSVYKTEPACLTWRRFANLFETSQTLFWASFGLVDLTNFELSGIKSYTRFWGMLMFGCYCTINVVVLLNLLIAMMNHSYQIISDRADIEWKFARSKLWISFFEEGGTAPPPFNIIPTPKSFYYVVLWFVRKCCVLRLTVGKKEHLKTIRRKVREANERNVKYQNIMRNLVRRYVTAEQRKSENAGVTEDDVNEVKQDISSFRYELIDILRKSGMNTSSASESQGISGKKNRLKERRLMKGFNIGLADKAFIVPEVNYEIAKKSPMNRLPRFARFGGGGHKDHKRRWGNLVEAAKNVKSHLGRSRSEDSIGSQSSPSQISPGDLSSNSNVSDISLGDVEIIPGRDRRRLRFWKETSTSTETPESSRPLDDMAACESGLSQRRFAVGVLSLNPAKLRASIEEYQKRAECQSKVRAKRTSSAPSSDRLGLSVRYKRHSKKNGDRVPHDCTILTSPPSTPQTPTFTSSVDIKAVPTDASSENKDCDNSPVRSGQPDLLRTSMDNGTFSAEQISTSQSQEPLVTITQPDTGGSKQSNGNALAMARAHGIQPVNRQMSAGWL
ncbi:TRPC1 (predicted) [Pycnogonum litorale]